MGLIREFPEMENTSTKMWTTGEYDLNGCTLHDFPYVVDINRDSLPWTWTQWCREQCSGQWAWWFDNHMCYVGFVDQSDSIWFTLTFVGSNN
jgi:hypothetical protein